MNVDCECRAVVTACCRYFATPNQSIIVWVINSDDDIPLMGGSAYAVFQTTGTQKKMSGTAPKVGHLNSQIDQPWHQGDAFF